MKTSDNPLIITRLPRAENGTRTRDLNLGKVALYQLSYFRMACFVIANAKVAKKSESPNFSIPFCKFFTICPLSYPLFEDAQAVIQRLETLLLRFAGRNSERHLGY